VVRNPIEAFHSSEHKIICETYFTAVINDETSFEKARCSHLSSRISGRVSMPIGGVLLYAHVFFIPCFSVWSIADFVFDAIAMDRLEIPHCWLPLR
jgi:hypothetical protein